MQFPEEELIVRKLIATSAVLAALLVMVAAPGAKATPLTLTLNDGSNPPVIVQDGGAGDSNPTPGVVTWIGSLGVWTVNVSTGLGYPEAGSLSWPYLDLNSVNKSTGAGTLEITLIQGGFTSPPPPAFLFQIGGTTQGTVDAWACAAQTITTCNDVHLGAFSGGAFSGATPLSFTDPGQPYELGIRIQINHAGTGVSSFDAEVSSVPEPGAYAMIGLGLAALGLLRRRISKSA